MKPQSFEQWMRDQTATLAPPKPADNSDLEDLGLSESTDGRWQVRCSSCDRWFDLNLSAEEIRAIPEHRLDVLYYCGGSDRCMP